MKYHLLILLAGAALVHRATAEPFVVHEWGTFTTVSGSDGKMLAGLEREEHSLPSFVLSHAGFSPANKGWDRPVANVTIKMETPVIYFYSDVPREVTVDVKFRGGSISQWYPERSNGEVLPPAPTTSSAVMAASPMDFARGYQGSASWKIDVLPRQTPQKISARPDLETPQWPRARVAAANKIRGTKGEIEGFIFYRGIGNFALPLTVKCDDGSVVLNNAGTEAIAYAFVYEKNTAHPNGVVWWSGQVGAGAQQVVALTKTDTNISAGPVLQKKFPQALMEAGLTADEARAMTATWRESYFERDGMRVFWIVPRALTDAVLPITISPRPEKLERVLVGRSEILTPAFEAKLKKDFVSTRVKAWESDRYYLAYLERARQLGVVLADARP